MGKTCLSLPNRRTLEEISFFDRWGIKLNQNMSKRDEITLYYLAYKTLKICSTYPHYKEISDWDSLMKKCKSLK